MILDAAIPTSYTSTINYSLINNELNSNFFPQQTSDWQRQYALNGPILNNANVDRFSNTFGIQTYNNFRCKKHFILYNLLF